MADSLETRIQIAVDAGAAAQSVGELKAAIRELEGIAVTAGDNNKAAFLKAAQEAGKLKDQIDDAKDAVATFKGDPIESLSKGIGSLKGRLMDLDFKGFSEEVGRLKTISGQVSFKELSSSIADTGKAFVNLGKVLLTNPIFLLVAVIGLIIANLDTLMGMIDGVSAAEQERLDLAKETAAASKEQLDAIGAQEETLKANGKSEEEILQLKIDAATVAAADAKAQVDAQKQIRDEQVAASERNKKILSGILQFVTIPLQALLYGIDQLTLKLKDIGIISEETYGTIGNLRDKFNEGISSMVFDPEETKKKGDADVKAAEKSATDLQNTLDGFRNKQKANREKDAEDRRKTSEAESEKERLRLEKEAADRIAIEKKTQKALSDAKNERLNEEEDLLEEIESFRLTEQEREERRINDEFFQKKNQFVEGSAEFIAFEEEQGRRIQEVRDRYRNDELTKEKEKIDKELEYQKQASEQRKELTIGVFDALLNLNSIFEGKTEKERKKAFNRNKALQIAQALIQTYQSATAAYASQLTIPTPDAPVRAAVAAGIAVAAGLAQVAKITKTKYEGSTPPSPDTSTGGGGGGLDGGGGAPAPTFTPPQFFGLGQGILQGGQPQGQQQVVVLENDITRTQNRVRVIENRATIG